MAGRAERERFVFAFTSHGFGHLSRTLRVLDAFLTRYPDVDATGQGQNDYTYDGANAIMAVAPALVDGDLAHSETEKRNQKHQIL